jgi:hypothetical protein
LVRKKLNKNIYTGGGNMKKKESKKSDLMILVANNFLTNCLTLPLVLDPRSSFLLPTKKDDIGSRFKRKAQCECCYEGP